MSDTNLENFLKILVNLEYENSDPLGKPMVRLGSARIPQEMARGIAYRLLKLTGCTQGTPPGNKALLELLKRAYDELIEHNNEYEHTTPKEFLKEIRGVIGG